MLSCGIMDNLHDSSFASRGTNKYRPAKAINSKAAIFVVIVALLPLAAYTQMGHPNDMIYVDRYKYGCSDAGVHNALKALPSAGGTVDVRGCEGAMTWASNIFSGVSAKSGRLLLGSVTVTLKAPQFLPSQWKIEGIPSTAG